MWDRIRAIAIRLVNDWSVWPRIPGRDEMAESSTAARVSPEEIKELIERAAGEPGLNDMLALARLSEEVVQDGQAQAAIETMGCAQVVGTAGSIL